MKDVTYIEEQHILLARFIWDHLRDEPGGDLESAEECAVRLLREHPKFSSESLREEKNRAAEALFPVGIERCA